VTDEVVILDDVVIPAEDADGWLDRWREEYLPGAKARGLRLAGVWRGSTGDPDRVTILIHWTLSSVDAFWAARSAAASDPSVVAFWRKTDVVVFARDRRVLAAVEPRP